MPRQDQVNIKTGRKSQIRWWTWVCVSNRHLKFNILNKWTPHLALQIYSTCSHFCLLSLSRSKSNLLGNPVLSPKHFKNLTTSHHPCYHHPGPSHDCLCSWNCNKWSDVTFHCSPPPSLFSIPTGLPWCSLSPPGFLLFLEPPGFWVSQVRSRLRVFASAVSSPRDSLPDTYTAHSLTSFKSLHKCHLPNCSQTPSYLILPFLC